MADAIPTLDDMAVTQARIAPGVTKITNGISAANMDAIDKKSKEFESVFLSQMLQPMFEGVEVDPIFGGGHGEEVMKSFLVEQYGKAMTSRGGFGIASMVKAAMIKAQEGGRAANKSSPSLGAAYANAPQ